MAEFALTRWVDKEERLAFLASLKMKLVKLKLLTPDRHFPEVRCQVKLEDVDERLCIIFAENYPCLERAQRLLALGDFVFEVVEEGKIPGEWMHVPDRFQSMHEREKSLKLCTRASSKEQGSHSGEVKIVAIEIRKSSMLWVYNDING